MSATNISCISEKEFDKQSRIHKDVPDWQPKAKLFKENCNKSVQPDINFFIHVSTMMMMMRMMMMMNCFCGMVDQ